MHDAADPEGTPPDSTSADPGRSRVPTAEALEAVNRVIGWYNARILDEGRAGAPNAEQLERFRAERQACLADRQELELELSPPARIAAIAAAYETRLRELSGG
ncbi:hypothetical protein [Embleya sp. NPDC020630]|uniref:hypothetical protein n=1 Tax=Embleya sp. NPDC020630 TaxID=3363979 RepID=UPI00378A0675